MTRPSFYAQVGLTGTILRFNTPSERDTWVAQLAQIRRSLTGKELFPNSRRQARARWAATSNPQVQFLIAES
jgi:hypothetical protein